MSEAGLSCRQDGILPHSLCTFCASWRMGFWRACSGEFQFAFGSGLEWWLARRFRRQRRSRQGSSVALGDTLPVFIRASLRYPTPPAYATDMSIFRANILQGKTAFVTG